MASTKWTANCSARSSTSWRGRGREQPGAAISEEKTRLRTFTSRSDSDRLPRRIRAGAWPRLPPTSISITPVERTVVKQAGLRRTDQRTATHVPPGADEQDLERMSTRRRMDPSAHASVRHIVDPGGTSSSQEQRSRRLPGGLTPRHRFHCGRTTTPTRSFEHACVLQDKIGAPSVGLRPRRRMFGFTYALTTAVTCGGGTHNTRLRWGDVMSSIIDYTDRSTAAVGDGGAWW